MKKSNPTIKAQNSRRLKPMKPHCNNSYSHRSKTARFASLLSISAALAIVLMTEQSPAATLHVLYAFGPNQDNGYNPNSRLVLATDGNFYGTCAGSGHPLPGSLPEGTVFRLTPSGDVTMVFTFHGSDGRRPNGVIQGNDGNFYGTTGYDGPSGGGTVFKVTPGGTRTTLYRFASGSPTGDTPLAALVKGRDGNFYGTTSRGGTNRYGTIFKITPGGTLTTLHNFGQDFNDTDGAVPQAPLVLGTDGNFYGTATNGGSDDGGTIFKITSGGTFTLLHSFNGTVGNTAEGFEPSGGLIQGSDGNFYGVTDRGGTSDLGVIYKITPAGHYTVLHSIVSNDGASPVGELAEGIDGNFYGVTGKTTASGSIYRITPAGAFTVLHYFEDAAHEGESPLAGLTRYADGNFYGTTYLSGPGLVGTAYKLTVIPAGGFVTTNPATLIASFSATLNGSVNPGGLPTTVYFEYGTTTSYGHTTASHSYNGSTTQSVSASISGLSASTTYHFRIVSTNSAGTRHGSDRTFTTLSATGAPVVITNPATLIASYSATLNGSVDPHGLTTSVYFQYGTTTSYGLTTSPQSKTGNTYQNVAAGIGSLSANTVYHFRIVATNSAGTVHGADRTFTTLSATGPPVVTTNPATNVTASSATLNGSLDPHGLPTNVNFQYGTTTSYGHTTPTQSQTGNTYRNITANISGLITHTTYHFRIVATNSAGTRDGSDKTFTTP
jgi:uncharacterized repeat protein (TIGR03803 family)